MFSCRVHQGKYIWGLGHLMYIKQSIEPPTRQRSMGYTANNTHEVFKTVRCMGLNGMLNTPVIVYIRILMSSGIHMLYSNLNDCLISHMLFVWRLYYVWCHRVLFVIYRACLRSTVWHRGVAVQFIANLHTALYWQQQNRIYTWKTQ